MFDKGIGCTLCRAIYGLAKWVPYVPKLFFDDGLIQSTHHICSFVYLEYYWRIGKFICGSGHRSQRFSEFNGDLFLTKPTAEHDSSETYPYVFIDGFLNFKSLKCCQCSGLFSGTLLIHSIFCQLTKFWRILYTNSHSKKLPCPKWNLIVAKVKMATSWSISSSSSGICVDTGLLCDTYRSKCFDNSQQ